MGTTIEQHVEETPAAVGVPAGFHVAEEVFSICPCAAESISERPPYEGCFWCHGTGYRLVRRIIRPLPTPDFSEQAALAQLKTKDTHLRMAAATVRQAADMLHAAGKKQQSDGMHNAARAIEALVEGQD